MDKEQKRSLKIIFFTVFLDLVGFGIILPLSPYLAREFSATEFEIGCLMAIFSLMQFLFSPLWGGLSDRIGRRPVILVSLIGAALSYIIFAFARDLTTLFIARAFAGLCAANISTAYAYVADITPKNKRSIGMGLLGAAFGLGFILGPVLAAVSGTIGETLGSEPPFGLQFSAVVAAVMNALAFAFAFFYLPETLKKGKTHRVSKLQGFRFVFSHRLLRPLMTISLFIGLGMALMEVMFFPFVQDRFGLNYQQASMGFAYVGVIMVLTQGYFIRKWIPRFGEKKVLFSGLIMMLLAFFGIGLSGSIAALAVAATLLALGNGCMRPPITGLASVLTTDEEQGFVMGVMNSLSAIGRIVGPVLGGWVYQEVSEGAPFFASGLMALIALILFLLIFAKLPNPQKKDKA